MGHWFLHQSNATGRIGPFPARNKDRLARGKQEVITRNSAGGPLMRSYRCFIIASDVNAQSSCLGSISSVVNFRLLAATPSGCVSFAILKSLARYPSGPRERSAKPPFVGSNPTRASNDCVVQPGGPSLSLW